MRLALVALALITSGNAAQAMTPMPVPPDPVAYAKVGELLDAVHYEDCLLRSYSPSADFAIRQAVEKLIEASNPIIQDLKDTDFHRLLALTFERQARDELAAMAPAIREERAKFLARILSPDEIDQARIYFTTTGGTKLVRDMFCDVDGDRVSMSISAKLLKQIEATTADVRQSYALMKKINNSGQRP